MCPYILMSVCRTGCFGRRFRAADGEHRNSHFGWVPSCYGKKCRFSRNRPSFAVALGIADMANHDHHFAEVAKGSGESTGSEQWRSEGSSFKDFV